MPYKLSLLYYYVFFGVKTNNRLQIITPLLKISGWTNRFKSYFLIDSELFYSRNPNSFSSSIRHNF